MQINLMEYKLQNQIHIECFVTQHKAQITRSQNLGKTYSIIFSRDPIKMIYFQTPTVGATAKLFLITLSKLPHPLNEASFRKRDWLKLPKLIILSD